MDIKFAGMNTLADPASIPLKSGQCVDLCNLDIDDEGNAITRLGFTRLLPDEISSSWDNGEVAICVKGGKLHTFDGVALALIPGSPSGLGATEFKMVNDLVVFSDGAVIGTIDLNAVAAEYTYQDAGMIHSYPGPYPGIVGDMAAFALVGNYVYFAGGTGLSVTARVNTGRINLLDLTAGWDESAVPDLPEGIVGGRMLQIGAYLYLFGGQTSGTTSPATNTIYQLDLSNPEATWILFGYMPFSRSRFALVSGDDGYLYFISGITSGSYVTTTSVWRTQASSIGSVWQDAEVSDLPLAVDQCKAVCYGGYIHVNGVGKVYSLNLANPSGGWSESYLPLLSSIKATTGMVIRGSYLYLFTPNVSSSVALQGTRIDLSAISAGWEDTAVADLSFGDMYSGLSATFEQYPFLYAGQIYIFTGDYQLGYMTRIWREKTNASASVWSSLALGNEPHGYLYYEAGYAVYGRKVFVLGGRRGSSPWKAVNVIDLDNPQSSWDTTTYPELPASLLGASAFTHNDYLYAFARKSNSDTKMLRLDLLNPASGWQDTQTASPARYRPAFAVYGDYLYVAGGSNSSGSSANSQVYRVNLSAIATVPGYENNAAWNLPATRAGMAFATHNGYLYVVGGTVAGQYSSSVMRLNMADPDAGWDDTGVPDLPAYRYGAVATVSDDVLYLFGGSGPGGQVNEVWQLDLLHSASIWKLSELPSLTGVLPNQSGVVADSGNFYYLFPQDTAALVIGPTADDATMLADPVFVSAHAAQLTVETTYGSAQLIDKPSDWVNVQDLEQWIADRLPADFEAEFSNFEIDAFKLATFAGGCLEFYNGKLYLAVDNFIYCTDTHNIGRMDIRYNVVAGFPKPVTMIARVADGLYVGTSDGVYFLQGAGLVVNAAGEIISRFSQRKVSEFGAIPGSRQEAEGVLIDGLTGVGMVAVWSTSNGIYAGAASGQIVCLSRDKMHLPATASAVSKITAANGFYQYLVCFDQDPANVAAGSALLGTYVINLQRAFHSRYDRIAFSGLFSLGTSNYGTGRFGLYRFEGDSDFSGLSRLQAKVAAFGLTPSFNNGQHTAKSLRELYLMARCNGSIAIDLIVDEELAYEDDVISYDDNTRAHTLRANPPQGLRGNFWQIKVKNVDGSRMELLTAKPVFATAKGRIR